jgi:diaminohydroxyphosphoribosylaminopyrimidine deaminase / 5-amino-6-(5-phosphoribosylamino)uracil reductase
MTKDEQYMQRCLELAYNGISSVAPNPMVGAVIVKDDFIIGEGYHEKYGGPHAEVNAIHSVENKSWLRNSTMYVNLEPCAHFGKTPPCAELIKEVGIPRIVVGTSDPNPLVNGKGIRLLKEAGCQVLSGILEDSSKKLNQRFFHFYSNGRPYIILKWAETEDGFIDKNRSADSLLQPNWITDDICRKLVHRWRTEEQAVMIGTNTALLDNPELNSRFWHGRNPIKLILDRDLKIPLTHNLFKTTTPMYLFNSLVTKQEGNNCYQKIDFDHLLDALVTFLKEKEIQSVLVEGGSKLIQSFIDKGIWDEARIFTGPFRFHEGTKAPVLTGTCILDDQISNSRLRILIP